MILARRMLVVAALAAAFTLTIPVVTEGAAMATPVNPTYTALATTEIPTDYSQPVLIDATEPIYMEAGLSYPMTSSWSGRSDYDTGSLLGQRIRCFTEGVSARYAAWATTNVLANQSASIYNRWLFTPTVSGLYSCELLAQAGHTTHRDRKVIPTQGALTIYTAGKPGGHEWRMTAGDRYVNSKSRTTWALKKEWIAPPGTTSVRLWSGPEVSCYSTGNHNPFVGEITTYANQIDNNGNVVKSWSMTTQKEIPGPLHHFKFGQSLTLDPRTDKPLRFRFSVRLRWVDKDGVSDRHGGILHGKVASSGTVYTAMHAYPLEIQ